MKDDELRCYGNARPTDTHLEATIVAVDEEIYDYIKRMSLRPLRRNALIALSVIAVLTVSVVAFAFR